MNAAPVRRIFGRKRGHTVAGRVPLLLEEDRKVTFGHIPPEIALAIRQKEWRPQFAGNFGISAPLRDPIKVDQQFAPVGLENWPADM